MKKIFLVFLLLITSSCSKKTDETDKPMDLDPMVQHSYEWAAVAPYEDGFFYVDQYFKLHYMENLEKDIYVNEMTFYDDVPVSQKDKADRYIDAYNMTDFFVYDQSIVYLAEYSNIKGEIKYELISMSLDGKTRKVMMEFPYQPYQFLIHRNTIITIEEINEHQGTLHMYDLNGKELHAFEEDLKILDLFADAERIYLTEEDYKTGECYIYCLHTEEDTIEKLMDNSVFVFERNGLLSYYQLNQLYKEGVDAKDVVTYAKIMNLETKEIVFEKDNEIVNYFDDTYIYCSNKGEEIRKYRIYDWNGNLVKEIVPSEHIDFPALFFGLTTKDYSEIVRIIDGNIIAYTLHADTYEEKYIACEIESGACRILGKSYE